MPKRRETYPFMGPEYISGSLGRFRTPDVQPVLPILLWGPNGTKRIDVAALVDTGADYCTCPSRLTKPIGYKIRSGKRIEFRGAVSTGKAWEHSVDVSILTHDYRAVFCKISKVPLHLVQKRNYFPVLLGRKGFLDQFIVHIDFSKKMLTLEMP